MYANGTLVRRIPSDHRVLGGVCSIHGCSMQTRGAFSLVVTWAIPSQGQWNTETDDPVTFLIPGLAIGSYVTGVLFTNEERHEMIYYLMNRTNEDGGWAPAYTIVIQQVRWRDVTSFNLTAPFVVYSPSSFSSDENSFRYESPRGLYAGTHFATANMTQW